MYLYTTSGEVMPISRAFKVAILPISFHAHGCILHVLVESFDQSIAGYVIYTRISGFKKKKKNHARSNQLGTGG